VARRRGVEVGAAQHGQALHEPTTPRVGFDHGDVDHELRPVDRGVGARLDRLEQRRAGALLRVARDGGAQEGQGVLARATLEQHPRDVIGGRQGGGLRLGPIDRHGGSGRP